MAKKMAPRRRGVMSSLRSLENFFEWRFLMIQRRTGARRFCSVFQRLSAEASSSAWPFSIRKLMHSVVNLPCEVFSSAKTISRHSSGCVADEGAVEALGGVELVAVAHGLGDAAQDGGEGGFGLVLDGGGEQILGE